MTQQPDEHEGFLSGQSGQVFGLRSTTRALLGDAVTDAYRSLRFEPLRLRAAAAHWPRRRVLAIGVERPDVPGLMGRARAELSRTHHELIWDCKPAGDRGKFENLNALLTRHDLSACDWLLVVDDDVSLPSGFLDSFVFLAERFGLKLAQPAHRHRSHAAWEVTRRRSRSVVRRTAFVEIGPVTAFHADTFGALLPFPTLRFGWGLDSHWSALARTNGWAVGIVDATPIRHGLRLIAASYDRGEAIEEARRFLRDRPHTTRAEAQRTLATYRSWR